MEFRGRDESEASLVLMVCPQGPETPLLRLLMPSHRHSWNASRKAEGASLSLPRSRPRPWSRRSLPPSLPPPQIPGIPALLEPKPGWELSYSWECTAGGGWECAAGGGGGEGQPVLTLQRRSGAGPGPGVGHGITLNGSQQLTFKEPGLVLPTLLIVT